MPLLQPRCTCTTVQVERSQPLPWPCTVCTILASVTLLFSKELTNLSLRKTMPAVSEILSLWESTPSHTLSVVRCQEYDPRSN
ncbi:hypothetical protein RRG08_000637 [Elysia crispata]|uniref:Uncharacterized protein n=1 Tax=Elysia crispata TaxID=231223 RepID=A0AAE0Y8Z0_9GAST|nr:hypothetical protein RRG08_000637 [Elysia crispata]